LDTIPERSNCSLSAQYFGRSSKFSGDCYLAELNLTATVVQAFFRINALLIRSDFAGGWLAIIAPYFIRIFMGDNGCHARCFSPDAVIYTLDPVKTLLLVY